MEENKNLEVVETKEEITVFGKIDQKIVSARKAKAKKKADKEKAKADKKEEKEGASEEKKKLNPKVLLAVGAGVLGAVGGVVVKNALDHSDSDYELTEDEIQEEPEAISEEAESSES